MKKLILPALFIIGFLSINAQNDKTGLLQSLKANNTNNQDVTATATLKSATRLFQDKNDLTSVILIIPSGEVLQVLDSDSIYLHVVYQDNEGYIYRKQALMGTSASAAQQEQPASDIQSGQNQPDSRYIALENKYGSSMAARIYAGKIWKGMNSEMVRDSWGAAEKINRVVNGNIIKEEWIYRSTWLYFEDNTLLKWGPVKR